MKYTENYHLPQWVKEDRIMMDDFNAAMSNLEDGLSRAVSDAAADTAAAAAKVASDAAAATAKVASDAAAATAQAAAAASSAQTTADRAIAAAAAAQATADAAYSPSQQPYVVGTYLGTAADMTFTLGFRPQFLIICCPFDENVHLYTTMIGAGMKADQVELTATGFLLHPNRIADSMEQPPLANCYHSQYIYIAFR